MRGAHSYGTTATQAAEGSPPHARGPLHRDCSRYNPQGITPACAGPTLLVHVYIKFLRDHPRMRGAHSSSTAQIPSSLGSPPHARGPLVDLDSQCSLSRITPACAGPTLILMSNTIPTWDHPRMRGAHHQDQVLRRPSRGSPPHARGPPRVCYDKRKCCGITPACAGPTLRFDFCRLGGRDHPRMRGAHFFTSGFCILMIGSPPHARGPHSTIVLITGLFRITPACAGPTFRR